MNPAHFTHTAAALVAANDRRTRRRALLRAPDPKRVDYA